jgi:hypothetical protein
MIIIIISSVGTQNVFIHLAANELLWSTKKSWASLSQFLHQHFFYWDELGKFPFDK